MSDQGDPDMLAAEYALGVLEGAALDGARRREAVDDDFAREVARWHGRLAPLLDEIDDAAAPDSWARIERAISSRPAANDNVRNLQRAVAAWRSAALAAGAIAAALAFMLMIPRQPAAFETPPRPAISTPMVAMLGQDNATTVVASWDPAARQLIIAAPKGMSADLDHSHELWVIPSGGKPHSLGTMPNGKQMHMRLAETLANLLRQGATIAISVEPRGGSRSGTPTGPVVASGTLATA